MKANVSVKLVKNRIPTLQRQTQRGAGLIVAKTARHVEAGAKNKAPVDTGNLKSSIQSQQIDALTWEIRVGAEYGIYVHDGTFRMASRPFLRQSLDEAEPAFVAAALQLIR